MNNYKEMWDFPVTAGVDFPNANRVHPLMQKRVEKLFHYLKQDGNIRRAVLFQTAKLIWETPQDDELMLNAVAYHLQQAVEKILKAALECTGVTIPNTHKITKLIQMTDNNGANLIITEWLDEHSEMLSEWEAETRYNMDFLVEKRKLERALPEILDFFRKNGITPELREELKDEKTKTKLLNHLPESKRQCTDFELNAYYIMFQKIL